MSVYKKGGSKATPGIGTSSLPDIVFMILFFFMATTSMREVTMKVDVDAPYASEVQKLEKKSLVSYVYVGAPKEAKFGSAPRIQLNDDFSTLTHIGQFVAAERNKLSEADRPEMTVSLKIDKNVRMGLVTDIKQELRKANALNISYSAKKTASAQ